MPISVHPDFGERVREHLLKELDAELDAKGRDQIRIDSLVCALVLTGVCPDQLPSGRKLDATVSTFWRKT